MEQGPRGIPRPLSIQGHGGIYTDVSEVSRITETGTGKGLHHDCLDPRELIHQGHVDDALDSRNREHEESSLPTLWDVGRVIGCDHALDESTDEECSTRNTSLP